ncbi:hypothetical protein AAIP55_001649 [Flavobacterium psychrophilum]|nr:hypothetical protein [Flavobacterium psychrophilum]
MVIAGKFTIKDWEELKIKLKPNYNMYWDEAYKYFELRICTRYLKPIDAILNMKFYNGEGFAVVNLQCSLIEMIESFINGWVFDYPNFINPKGIILNGNDKIFKSFFNNRVPFKNYTPKISGKRFYVDVRCGLLHEAQTKNNWKIKKGIENGNAYEFDGNFKIIYRENFQRDLKKLIENYKHSIIYGIEFDGIPACELRENFISKFNHICKES